MAHSNLVGGSTAARVIACPASVPRSAELVKVDRPSAAAEQGTALHICMEMLLLGQCELYELFDRTINGVKIDADLYVEKLVPAWLATEEFLERYSVETYEPELQVSFCNEPLQGAFGTIDLVGLTSDGTPVFVDFKFGSGYDVSVENNPQLAFYAAASLNDEKANWLWEHDPKECLTAIIQPTFEPITQVQHRSVKELRSFEIELAAAIMDARSDHPTARTGDHCRWCPAAPWCPDKMQQAEIALELSPDDQEQMAHMLTLAFQLEEWARTVKNNAHAMLEQTTAEIPGFKLVKKRATRRWRDEPALLDQLKRSRKLSQDDYANVSIKSPAQLEKVCKQKDVDFTKFTDMIESVSSGTTLATEDDPRPAVKRAAGREIPENLQKLNQQ